MSPNSEQSPKNLKTDIKINFIAEGQPVEVNLQNIENVCADLKTYNKRYSLGGVMASMVISHFEKEVGTQDNILEAEKDGQELDSFFLIATKKEELKKIGLKLEPVTGTSTIVTQESQANLQEMAIKIENFDRFTPFLTALTEENISGTNLKESLEKIPIAMAKEIVNDCKSQSDHIEIPTKNLKGIIEQYKRLGMSQSVEKIEKYLEYHEKGCLKEYVIIDGKNLLAEPGTTFGPAEWQSDSTPEMLERRWNEAVHILYIAKQNPKADELSEKLRQHLETCIKLGLVDLRSNMKEGLRRSQLEVVLESAKQKLEQIL